jgi:hypothetical protein
MNSDTLKILKFSCSHFKSYDKFILRHLEVKSEAPFALIGEKLVLLWATGAGKLPGLEENRVCGLPQRQSAANFSPPLQTRVFHGLLPHRRGR